MKNPLTTISGLIGAIAYGVSTAAQNGCITPRDIILSGVMALVGFFAKDGVGQANKVPFIILPFLFFTCNDSFAQTQNVRTHISNLYPYSDLTSHTSTNTGDTVHLTPLKSGTYIKVDTIPNNDTLVISMRDTVAGVIKNVRRNGYMGDQIIVDVNFASSTSVLIFDGIYWKSSTLTYGGGNGIGWRHITWVFNGSYWTMDNSSALAGSAPKIYNSFFGGDSIPTGSYIQMVDSVNVSDPGPGNKPSVLKSVYGDTTFLMGKPSKFFKVRVNGTNLSIPAY